MYGRRSDALYMCMWVRRIKASVSASETLCAREIDREKERERESERASERASERESVCERERNRDRERERERERGREGGKSRMSLSSLSSELQKTKQGASPVCVAPS